MHRSDMKEKLLAGLIIILVIGIIAWLLGSFITDDVMWFVNSVEGKVSAIIVLIASIHLIFNTEAEDFDDDNSYPC